MEYGKMAASIEMSLQPLLEQARWLHELGSHLTLIYRQRHHPYSFLLHLTTTTSTKMALESYTFGPYKKDNREVFYSTNLSYALVNLRPIVPDVLIIPRREVKRIADLTVDETSDLWITAQKIGRRLESYHKATSLTFGVQDGPQAGQTVPHVHIHILPRKDATLDKKEKKSKKKLDSEKERKDRSLEEMTQEAEEYRKLFL